MPGARESAVGLILLLVTAAPAAAQQEPGVTVDPGSPSAKQYVLPLDSARHAAAPKAKPGSGAKASPTASAPDAQLFGAGVSRSRSNTHPGGTTRRGAPATRRHRRAPHLATAGPSQLPAVVRRAAANPGDPGGGVGTTALVLGGAALVLLAGLGAGLAARRRMS